METFLSIMNMLGYATTIFVVIVFVAGVIAWFKGIFPALLRLGNGLAKRKIAIFAKSDALSSLTNLLVDSGLIIENNLMKITKVDDFGKPEGATLFLVSW